MPTPERPPIENNDITAEQSETIPRGGIIEVAESYALAQIEFETKVMTTANSWEWSDAALEIADKYPPLAPYRKVFACGARNMAERKATINSFWSATRQSMRQEEPTTIDETGETAGPKLSSRLFHEALGSLGKRIDLTGSVKAVNGPTSLKFELDQDDIDHLQTIMMGPRKGQATAFYCPIPLSVIHTIPTLFVARPEEPDNQAAHDNYEASILHEDRHLLNNGTTEAYTRELFMGTMKMVEEDEGMRKLFKQAIKNLENTDTPQEQLYKDELDAYFTQLVMMDERVPGGHPDFPPERVVKILAGITDIIVNQYFNPGEVAPAFRERTQAAAEAFGALRNHYIDNQGLDPAMAGNITSRMLQVFPLKSWPSVTRLALSRHERAKVDDGKP